MKKLCGFILLGLAVISASASEIEKRRAEEIGKKYTEYTTSAGRIYKEVTITEINNGGISITHADGLARLRFEHLTPEQRRDFGITEEASRAIYTDEKKAQAAYEAKVEAERKAQQKAKEEFLAKHTSAQLEEEKLMAERAKKQALTTKIESTTEIPVFPTIRGSENAVLYETRRSSPSRRSYNHYGGYVYLGNHGYYYPAPYRHYSSPRHCNPVQRNSIFHFTIK